MRENFVAVVCGDLLEICSLSVDFFQKEIIFKKREILGETEKIFESGNWRLIRKTLLGIFPLRRCKIILVFSPRWSFTLFRGMNFLRDNPRESIDEAELENIVSKATLEFLRESQKESGESMGLPYAEMLLYDARLEDLRVDGRFLVNPSGNKGRNFSMHFSAVALNRSLFRKFERLLPWRARLAGAFTGGACAAKLISEVESGNFIFAEVSKKRTYIFEVKRENAVSNKRKESLRQISFRDFLEWGENRFYEDLSREWGVASAVMRAMVAQFSEDKMSPHISRRMKKSIEDAIMVVERGLRHFSVEAGVKKVFLYMSALQKADVFSKMIKPLNSNFWLDNFGFRIVSGADAPDLAVISSLLCLYFMPKSGLANRLARRRIRWLLSGN